jgi:hypothetical protein
MWTYTILVCLPALDEDLGIHHGCLKLLEADICGLLVQPNRFATMKCMFDGHDNLATLKHDDAQCGLRDGLAVGLKNLSQQVDLGGGRNATDTNTFDSDRLGTQDGVGARGKSTAAGAAEAAGEKGGAGSSSRSNSRSISRSSSTSSSNSSNNRNSNMAMTVAMAVAMAVTVAVAVAMAAAVAVKVAVTVPLALAVTKAVAVWQ